MVLPLMSTAIVWFRNDLRLRHNAVLYKAINRHEQVIPVYIFDNHYFETNEFGFKKTGPFRAKFLIEAVADLRRNLESFGGQLLVEKGDSATVLKTLSQQYHVEAIYAQKEVCAEELAIEQAVTKSVSCPLDFTWTSTLLQPENLPLSIAELPDIFTDFRKKCEKYVPIETELKPINAIKCPENIPHHEIPDLNALGLEEPEVDTERILDFKGGETEAWNRLNQYFWQSEELSKYKHKRNGLLGADYSSKFSPWLALGCISPVSIYHEVKRFEKRIIKNESTYWLVFELLWHDYFRFVCAKYGNMIFWPGGIRNEKIKWKWNAELFEKWRLGQTGVPFVDANMKELLQTGFMSNRGRQNVASFLVKDLGIDWRAGASWFESQLIDYDVCSNYGNWNYIAGIGNDPRDERYFNVVWQAKKYDANAAFIKTWLPALEHLCAEHAIEPWKTNDKLMHYPKPIVQGRFMK
ncbi:DASH family cryptochrome [bacterium]|nr:DASH family cryptochrome [bacterium]